ncbi:MAG: hypothetical protein ABIO38_03780 [Luteimonas sp.]
MKFADGSSSTVQLSGERSWQRFSWTTRSKAVSAQLDPDHRIYLDTSKLDDSRTLKSNRSAARRWGSDVAALAQTLFSLLAGL